MVGEHGQLPNDVSKCYWSSWSLIIHFIQGRIMTLDEIREAINVRYELNFNNRSDLHDHLLIGGFLHRNKDKIPKGEFDKIRALMLNFTVSANILALRLIYHKYVLEDNGL